MVEQPSSSKETERASIELLLPSREKLKPCGPDSAFAEAPFQSGEFAEQKLQTQLLVAKEIIRQAIQIDYFPDSVAEANLAGDCFTSAKYLVEYLEKLGVSGKAHLVSVRRNPFNGEQRKSTRHVVVLHEHDGVFRTVDPTAMVGYGYGSVGCECTFKDGVMTSLGEERPIYEHVELLTDKDKETIEKINRLRREYYTNGKVDIKMSDLLGREVEASVGGDYMSSWVSEIYYVLAMTHLSRGEVDKYQELSAKVVDLDPFKPKVAEVPETQEVTKEKVRVAMEAYTNEVLEITRKWQEDVRKIWSGGDQTKYHEALEKMQWVFRELKSVGHISDPIPTFNLNNKLVAVYNLNPRALHEAHLTATWIKPNSSRMGVWAAAHEAIRQVGPIVAEYEFNLGISGDYGETPIYFTHPHALKPENRKAYTGPSTIMLINADPEEVDIAKKKFRDEWGRIISQKSGLSIPWFDGTSLQWNQFVTNYIHSADNAAESVVHFTLAYPHLSLVNRWAYPHPNL